MIGAGWNVVQASAEPNLFGLCRAQPTLCKAQMLPIAQGSALGERRPRLIHSAFLRRRKNATRRKRVTHYALNSTRGVAPHKAGCSYRARHFNQCNIVPPGRCPGLSAAIGLTARHTCAANAVKSCIYMFLFSSLTNISYRGRIELKTFCIFAALFLILQCCLLIELIYALR